MSTARRGRVALALVIGVVSSTALMMGTAQAYTVPFKDPNSVGLIGFCDQNDQPVTQGSINDVPFAFKAVSTTPAGKAWAGTGRKAALFATSPMKNLDPGLWSPYQMMPSSFYTNPRHPMAAAGYGEPPLDYHVTGAPPTWDGLVQFRMYLSAPNTAPYTRTYPTAVVQVTGDHWVMVAGDFHPACGVGTSKNINQVLTKSEPTAPPSWAANASPKATPSAASSSPGGSAGASSEAATPTSDPSSGISAVAASEPSTSGNSLGLWAALLMAVVAAVFAGLLVTQRRKARVGESAAAAADEEH